MVKVLSKTVYKRAMLILGITMIYSLNAQGSTVIIHGTLPPVMHYLVRKYDCPLGLIPAHTQENQFLHNCIAFILNESDSTQFPLERSYLFGWSGKLHFDARLTAAYELYHHLKKLPGPITLIGHSHGCNVALNLARIAHEYGDDSLSIDRLVLLACPVQKATAQYCNAPLFKKIYSLYSTRDIAQIIDPQGMYRESRRYKYDYSIPFFSERLFHQADHIIQARILIDMHNPWHRDFIIRKIIGHLPSILTLMDKASEVNKKKLIINISSQSTPHLVEKKIRNKRIFLVPVNLDNISDPVE